jgi:predicted flavoprotein YhiN
VHWGDVPDWDAALRTGGKGTVGTVVRDPLPRRLADVLLDAAGVDAAARRSELSRSDRARLVDVLGRFPLPVAGSEGYRTAEVTAGGVLLDEVATKSLESRIVPGLHLCGEVLDVTGRLGGYNFLWAWVSGRRAGVAAADGAEQVPA